MIFSPLIFWGLPGIEWVTSPYVKGRWGGVILFQVTRIPLSVWA